MDASNAELIWIAESDDFADLTMLESLLPCFRIPDIRLAYCYPLFVNHAGEPDHAATKAYFDSADSEKWNQPYIETSHIEVNARLGVQNTIPNVGCAVFRKPENTSFMTKADEYTLCGDWYFYLEICRGWNLAFNPSVHSYFRLQDSGVTGTVMKTSRYVEEHVRLFQEIAGKYRISADTARRFFQRVEHVCSAKDIPVCPGSIPSAEELEAILDQRQSLNVLLITQGFFLGGGEIVPVNLANELRRQGHTVMVITLDVFPAEPSIRSQLSKDVAVFTVRQNFATPGMFRAFLEDHGIDVINSHGHGSDLFVLRNIGASHTPWVVSMHGGYETVISPAAAQENLSRHEDNLRALRRQLERVDRWTYLSGKNLQPFRSEAGFVSERFIQVNNGFANPVSRPLTRAELGIPADAFVMCSATRAIPEKGWREAIELATLVRARTGKPVHLILLGDGPVYDELKADPAPEFVHALGLQSPVSQYFDIADLGLLLSNFSGESVPLCVIECLGAGRPALVTDVGECRRMLTDENGTLAGAVFPVANGALSQAVLEAMADWVASLIADPEAHMRLKSTARNVSENFSMENVANDYVNIYHAAIERRHHINDTVNEVA